MFMCGLCDTQFASKETLKKHTEDFHVEKEVIDFSCTVCDVKCSNKRNLAAHEKTHQAPTSNNKCVLCPKGTTFKQARNLRRHYILVHLIVPEFYFKPNASIDMCFRHTYYVWKEV